jgi:hypothetical protein
MGNRQWTIRKGQQATMKQRACSFKKKIGKKQSIGDLIIIWDSLGRINFINGCKEL